MNPGVMPAGLLSVRRSLVLLLGLAAVISGIIGMHILNMSHHSPGTGIAGHSFTATASGQAAHHAHSLDGAVSADGADGTLHAAGCTGPCSGDHDVMAAVCVLMTIVAGFALAFIPQRIRIGTRHGLRAPPHPLSLALPELRPPSLVQLSISRT